MTFEQLMELNDYLHSLKMLGRCVNASGLDIEALDEFFADKAVLNSVRAKLAADIATDVKRRIDNTRVEIERTIERLTGEPAG